VRSNSQSRAYAVASNMRAPEIRSSHNVESAEQRHNNLCASPLWHMNTLSGVHTQNIYYLRLARFPVPDSLVKHNA
jgi:hypothetical protein